MQTSKIKIELSAPVLWQKTQRHRPKWVLVTCDTQADVPILTADDAPVIAKVTPNQKIIGNFYKKPTQMIWRSGPNGPLRNIEEIFIKPRIAISEIVDQDAPKDLEKAIMGSFDGKSSTFEPANRRLPILSEQEANNGIILDDRRQAMQTLAKNVLEASALIDGVPYLPAQEPVWRVSHQTRDFQISVPNDADAIRHHRLNDDIDRGNDVRHIFRIDRYEEALTAARQMGERSRLSGELFEQRLHTDQVEFDPSYLWRVTELELTMQYALRGFDQDRVEVRAAIKAVREFERGGDREVMTRAVTIMIKTLGTSRWSKFAALSKRLETIADADYSQGQTRTLGI